MPKIDVSLIVATYNRPSNLALCLKSLELQQEAIGRFEVVVAADGSENETKSVVSAFAKRVPYPVTFTSHEHEGFRLARTRNEGVLASCGSYLIFLDGDVAVPSNFVQAHMDQRAPGTVMVGDTCWLDRGRSEQMTDEAVEAGVFLTWISNEERKRLRGKFIRGEIYSFLRLPSRPRMKGSNIAIWRSDFQQVNGYDEEFVGWGLEDTDLQRRLARAGVRFQSSMRWTRTYHIWHPYDPSYVPKARGTRNEVLLKQRDRPPRCSNGLNPQGDFAVIRWNGESSFEDQSQNKYARVVDERGEQRITV
jgi:GT2 family glycosyltransferase